LSSNFIYQTLDFMDRHYIGQRFKQRNYEHLLAVVVKPLYILHPIVIGFVLIVKLHASARYS